MIFAVNGNYTDVLSVGRDKDYLLFVDHARTIILVKRDQLRVLALCKALYQLFDLCVTLAGADHNVNIMNFVRLETYLYFFTNIIRFIFSVCEGGD